MFGVECPVAGDSGFLADLHWYPRQYELLNRSKMYLFPLNGETECMKPGQSFHILSCSFRASFAPFTATDTDFVCHWKTVNVGLYMFLFVTCVRQLTKIIHRRRLVIFISTQVFLTALNTLVLMYSLVCICMY